jgi:hypothetical protein
MKFIHRLGYYLGGFSIGLIFLAFFLSGKRASCDYGPDARVLKNIGQKKIMFSKSAEVMMLEEAIDSTKIYRTLRTGDVNFSESNTSLKTCKLYVIYKTFESKQIKLFVENCDDIATVKSISVK